MKIPRVIDNRFLAPCGVDCMFCHAHLREKKQCGGCLGEEEKISERCRNCAIKNCAGSKGYVRCFECEEFPCARIKRLSKSYVQKYHINLIENGIMARDKGIEAFLKTERSRWKCKECGGAVSMHYGICSECSGKF